MTTRSAIIQCRLSESEKADFIKAAATQKERFYNIPKSPSKVLRQLVLDFTKANLPKVDA